MDAGVYQEQFKVPSPRWSAGGVRQQIRMVQPCSGSIHLSHPTPTPIL